MVLKITQKDRTILVWIFSELKVGKVVCNRTVYDWIVKDQNHIVDLLNNLKPYLRVKKAQAEYAVGIIRRPIVDRCDLMEVALLADALARLNVRSERRRKNYALMIQEGCLP